MTTHPPNTWIEEKVEEYHRLEGNDWEVSTALGSILVSPDDWLRTTLEEAESRARKEEREQNILDTLTYNEAIKWWLDHYEGIEHCHVNPEMMYTITTILGRCFEAILPTETDKTEGNE